jgi:L-threonylcarbamoyladenylate synthase
MRDPVEVLRQGGVVAAATESFFGLLVDATRSDGVDRLLACKPRGAAQGVPLIVPNREAWAGLVTAIPALAVRLADACWPGPLTIVLPAASSLDARLALRGRIGVRLAGPCAAAALARRLGRPVTATSANLPGEPPAVDSEAVRAVFGADLVHVVEGQAPGGAPSTVVVVEGERYEVARWGRIDADRLAAAAGLDPSQGKG